ncbi:hypothetical protein GOV13_00105 [Candidatus Pacearchaeota archaeon]|nr:hypothetical protein [Candidatus Pacearchaeota archaeon]
MLNKKGVLQQTYLIVGIIVGLIIIGGFVIALIPYISDTITDSNPPFDITISPDYINEGQYDEFNFKFTLTMLSGRNITFLKLAKSNVIVDRVDKNPQTKVSKNINWDKDYDDNYVFYKGSNSFGFSRKLDAEGSLWGCDNCFMVEQFPYKFTFTFTYSEDGGEEKPLILEKIIPIVG